MILTTGQRAIRQARGWRFTLLAGILLLLLAASAMTGCAGIGTSGTSATPSPVSVTVHAGTSGPKVPDLAPGMNVQVWDAHLTDGSIPGRLRSLHTRVVRYPGGSTSDIYHWETNGITSGQQGYASPYNDFDSVTRSVVKPAHAEAMVTVNYGSNAAGTAGGSPAEAAAWVRHANVEQHDGVRYWEIGNEVYGNGYYGAHWETDLHADRSPTAYAQNSLGFIRQMKAADPPIKVGLVLTAPGLWPDGQGPQNWNSTVLSIAGKSADFVSIHWYPQQPGQESDARLLASVSAIPTMVKRVRALLVRYCRDRGQTMPIMVTETNSVTSNPGKQTVSGVNGLFAIESYLAWLRAGAGNVTWWALHNSPETENNNSARLVGKTHYGDYGLLSTGDGPEPSANTPFPSYWALQMASNAALPSSRFLATSGTRLVAAYALRGSGGRLSVLLLRTDTAASRPVQVQISDGHRITRAAAQVYSVQFPRMHAATVGVHGASFRVNVGPRSAVLLTASEAG